MVRGVDDADGYPCGGTSLAECCDRAASLCELHADRMPSLPRDVLQHVFAFSHGRTACEAQRSSSLSFIFYLTLRAYSFAHHSGQPLIILQARRTIVATPKPIAFPWTIPATAHPPKSISRVAWPVFIQTLCGLFVAITAMGSGLLSF
jgi:hypothetical protein